MKKSASYERGKLILKQTSQQLLEEVMKNEGSQINFDDFANILHSVEDATEYGSKVVEGLRSGLTRAEEISLLSSFFMDTPVECKNVLKDWVLLRRIEGESYCALAAAYLLEQSRIRDHLNYIYYLQGNGLLGVSTENWVDELYLKSAVLNAFDNLFNSSFNCPSFFFLLGEREKNYCQKFSIRKGVENTIKDYQNIVEKLPSVPILMNEACSVEMSKAGCLILDALVRGEAKKIKEAKVHLERLKNFLLHKGKPLKSLEKITELGTNTYSFSQILFFLKEKKNKLRTGIHHYMYSDQSFLITLPGSFSYYSHQPWSLKDRLNIRKENFFGFILSSLPDNFKEIYKNVQGCEMVDSLKDWSNFCESFYGQRLDYAAIKEIFINYVIARYHITAPEAGKVYGFLKEKVKAEDWALLFVVADIILSSCIIRDGIDWEAIRRMVEYRLIVKILESLKRS